MNYCTVEDVGEGPNGYRPKVFQVPSGPVDPVDLVLSIAVLVILGVNGGEGSVRDLILLCVLSVGSCGRLCASPLDVGALFCWRLLWRICSRQLNALLQIVQVRLFV